MAVPDLIEEIYRDYTQTTIIVEKDGSETHISPPGHYTNETKEQVFNRIVTDPEFAKQLNVTIYTKVSVNHKDVTIGIVYKNNILEFNK